MPCLLFLSQPLWQQVVIKTKSALHLLLPCFSHHASSYSHASPFCSVLIREWSRNSATHLNTFEINKIKRKYTFFLSWKEKYYVLFFLEVEGEQFLAWKIVNTLRTVISLRSILLLLVCMSPYRWKLGLISTLLPNEENYFSDQWGIILIFFHIKAEDQIFLELCSVGGKLQ